MMKQSTIVAVGIIVAAQLTFSVPVQAGDNTGAFIGGVMAARVGRNMRERTEAEQQQAAAAQQQAYNSQQQVQQAAPAAARTPEQRLQELDKLAAGGYITPEEYKAKKKAIIDGM